MYGGGFLGGILHLVFWALIIWLIVSLVRRSRMNGGNWKNMMDGAPWNNKGPIDILKERYAKGEINKEEFEAKKKDLQ